MLSGSRRLSSGVVSIRNVLAWVTFIITVVKQWLEVEQALDRSLMKHLTLRHFPQVLCYDLPKRYPFLCPYIDCSQARTSLHSLMLHYGSDHQVSVEIYLKQKDVNTSHLLRQAIL